MSFERLMSENQNRTLRQTDRQQESDAAGTVGSTARSFDPEKTDPPLSQGSCSLTGRGPTYVRLALASLQGFSNLAKAKDTFFGDRNIWDQNW